MNATADSSKIVYTPVSAIFPDVPARNGNVATVLDYYQALDAFLTEDVLPAQRAGETATKYIGRLWIAGCILAEDEWDAMNAAPAGDVVDLGLNDILIPVGYYTVTLEDGTRVTLRVSKHWKEDEAAKGITVVSYLNGPCNTSDYAGFAFLNGSAVTVWGRCKEGHERQIRALYVLAMGTKPEALAAGEAYAQDTGRCFICNRLLTVPSSISASVGPKCAKRIWSLYAPGVSPA